MAELPGVETEQIIPGSVVVGYELSDAQREAEATCDTNTTTGITVVTTQVDEVPEVDINESSDG